MTEHRHATSGPAPARRDALKLLGVAAASAALLSPLRAFGQAWPSKPIKIIVPFAPGGTTDLIARLIGTPMAQTLGQPVIVENRPGVGGLLGVEATAKAPSDGYTLVMANISLPFAILTAQRAQRLNFDPATDLRGVSIAANVPMVITAPAASPAKDLREFAALVQRESGSHFVYGSPGAGSYLHVFGEWLQQEIKAPLTHVPFKGAAPLKQELLVSRHRSSVGLRWPSKRIAALHRLPIRWVLAARCALRCAPMAARSLRHLIGDATLAGRVHLGGDQLSTSLADIQAGKLRALAIAAEQRSALLPSVPTLREQGFGGIDIEGWNGLLAPSGTPADILSRLQAAAAGAVRDPQVQQRLQTLGAEPVGSDAQSLDGLLQQQRARFLPMVAQLKLE